MRFTLDRLRRQCTATQYRPEIDGLRFFAIGVVLLGHIAERIHRFAVDAGGSTPNDPLFALFSEPANGVLLFFAISGFIIACQFMRDGSISRGYLKKYFRRRVLRIEPPYFVILTLTYIVVALIGFVPADVHRFWGEPKSIHESFLASLFYAHTWLFGTMPRLFGPGWSLEIEVQFYVLAPIFFLLYFGTKNRKLRALYGVVVLVLAMFGNIVPLPAEIGKHVAFSLFRFFAFFWIGVLFADFQNIARKAPAFLASLAGWLGLCGFFLTGILFANPQLGVLHLVFQVCAVSALFLAVLAEGSSVRRFCSLPWIAIIGGACYSIYLTHLQTSQLLCHQLFKLMVHVPLWITLCVNLVIGLSAAIVVGLVFYVLIERPCMNPNWPALLWTNIRSFTDQVLGRQSSRSKQVRAVSKPVDWDPKASEPGTSEADIR